MHRRERLCLGNPLQTGRNHPQSAAVRHRFPGENRAPCSRVFPALRASAEGYRRPYLSARLAT